MYTRTPWSTYNDGERGFRFLYPQNWTLSTQQERPEDEAAIQIVPSDRADISMQVIVHKGELAFDPFHPENSSDLIKDSGYSYYELDKIPLDRQVERQHLTVYTLVFRDPKQPNLSSFLIRGDGYSLEFRMQYPIGLSASQEIMDTLSSVVVSTNMDKPPGTMPAYPVPSAAPFPTATRP